MLLKEWLSDAQRKLKLAVIPSYFIDSLIIAEHVLKKDRAFVLANGDNMLKKAEIIRLELLLGKRLKNEPIAYLVNNCYFYGHSFYVNRDVLIPKPESEDFLNLLKEFYQSRHETLLDVGTGSGCLAISSKIKYPQLEVFASDKYQAALDVAIKNSKKLCAPITFFKADMVPAELTNLDIIFSNLPYVPNRYKVSSETIYEPKSSIFAGDDGLDLIRRLVPKAAKALNKNGLLFIESMRFQHKDVENILDNNGFTLLKEKALIQVYSKK